MTTMCNGWTWTPQMDDWFTRQFLRGEDGPADPILARLLPDLPADIHLPDPPPPAEDWLA